MSRLAQIRHVLMKDFHEARWQLGVYVAIVAVATAHSVGLKGAGGEIFGYTMMLVVMFGMIVIASIVQGDSPIRADAFWAARPLYPSSVLLAKFAMAVIVLVGVAELGQLAGLLAHHVAARDLPRELATSMADYCRWLLIAMVFAVITRELRTFLLTLMAIPAYYFLNAVVLSGSDFQLGDPSHATAAAAVSILALLTFAAGGVGLLTYLYRARDTRPRTWIAAIAVFIAGMTYFTAPTVAQVVEVEEMPDGTTVTHQPEQISGRAEPVVETPPSVQRPALTLMATPFHAHNPVADEPPFTLRIDADSLPANERLSLVGATASYHTRDGATFRERFMGDWNPLQFGIHAATGLTWLDARDQHESMRVRSMEVSMIFSDSLKEAFARKVTSLGFDGRVAVLVPDFVDTIPLRAGASAAHGGERTTVTKVSYGSGHAMVTIASSEVLLDDSKDLQSVSGSSDPGHVDYALVNETRREAIGLNSRGTGYQSGWLVLPGAMTRMGSTLLQTAGQHSQSRIDDAWFRDAHILITHWGSRGSYPVHSETKLPAENK
jgi:hypothetical protein